MSLDLMNDRIALQDLMLNYAAGVDERDIERYRSCFAEDVVVVNFGDDDFHGRDTWVDYVWAELDKYTSTQHLLGPQFATISGERAETRSDVQALHYLVLPSFLWVKAKQWSRMWYKSLFLWRYSNERYRVVYSTFGA